MDVVDYDPVGVGSSISSSRGNLSLEKDRALAFSSSEEIKVMYDDLDVPINVIAAEKGVTEESVKIVLASVSPKFKSVTSQLEHRALFSKEDIKLATQTIRGLAQYGSVESVKMNAARFIIDESAGRHDQKTHQQIQENNVLVLNQIVIQAREQIKRAKQQSKLKDTVINAPRNVVEESRRAEIIELVNQAKGLTS